MKKNNSTSTNVTISATTLNCLKQMLFSANEGVDLSNIINDLAVDSYNEDLTAINVALAFKGIKPEIDRTPRFGDLWESNSAFSRYEVVDYSLIRNVVKCRVISLCVSPDGSVHDDQSREVYETTVPYDSFLGYATDTDYYVARILEYREKHNK